jgi:hypothetical protein
MPDEACYGALAELSGPDALLAAARRAVRQGYRHLEAFSPLPVEGLSELLGPRDTRVLQLGLAGGILGAIAGFGMQVYTNYDYPLNVGGRPLYAFAAFLMVGFWITILGAALAAGLGMLALNRLPRLHHPLFAASRFHLVSRDRFFLCIRATDPQFSREETLQFLAGLDALSVELVPA